MGDRRSAARRDRSTAARGQNEGARRREIIVRTTKAPMAQACGSGIRNRNPPIQGMSLWAGVAPGDRRRARVNGHGQGRLPAPRAHQQRGCGPAGQPSPEGALRVRHDELTEAFRAGEAGDRVAWPAMARPAAHPGDLAWTGWRPARSDPRSARAFEHQRDAEIPARRGRRSAGRAAETPSTGPSRHKGRSAKALILLVGDVGFEPTTR